jgi:uncharacterized membrane protein
MDEVLLLFRWIHFLAGVTWIGMLYYFNFVQTPFFGETEASVKNAAVSKLLPRALWWFRWGAMFTFLSGFLYYLYMYGQMGDGFFSSSYGVAITIGATLGTLMFLNVWLVIWPAQKVVIASTNQVLGGGQADPSAAGRGKRAGIVSRTNTLFSIPMLLFMGTAKHYTLFGEASGATWAMFVIVLILIALIEINSLVGTEGPTKTPLTTVAGTLWAGFITAAVFFILMNIS